MTTYTDSNFWKERNSLFTIYDMTYKILQHIVYNVNIIYSVLNFELYTVAWQMRLALSISLWQN